MTTVFCVWNLSVHTEKQNDGLFFIHPLSYELIQSEKRGGCESLPCLMYRAVMEGEGKNKLDLITVVTYQLRNFVKTSFPF